MCSAVTASPDVSQREYTWTGFDEFSRLRDRVDAPPLPLPSIKQAKRVVLVRHGQSTWNAEGRIQGSSNVSVLTQKGESQAETTRQMVHVSFSTWVFQCAHRAIVCRPDHAACPPPQLKDDKFDALYHSPLARADQTAQIVWGSRSGPVTVLPSLREIDLYSFQVAIPFILRFHHCMCTWLASRLALAALCLGHLPSRMPGPAEA